MKNTPFITALKDLRRTGTARATGDSLRAMYAQMIVSAHGGDTKTAELYFNALPHDEQACVSKSRELLRDRAASWEFLMGAIQ
jgi:hypothetical protein